MSRNENMTLPKVGDKCTAEESKLLHIMNSSHSPEQVEKKSIWSQMTLEPMWFGVTNSMIMALIAFKNLHLQRACLVDLGYSEDMCFRSEGAVKMAIELESQTIVSSLGISSGFFSGVVTSIILVFLGPWSDSSGRRKPLLILPIVGSILASLGVLILQAFPKVSTVWVIYVEVIPLAIGGNFSLLVMAACSHLGDICFKTGRCITTVIGSNSGTVSACLVFGSIVGPLLYRIAGFVGIFAISIALELSSLVYVIWRVHDINVVKNTPSIFDLTLPYQALKCVFKKRENNRRKMVLLMVIVPCTSTILTTSEISISYMYLRNKFDWTEMEYGTLLSIRNIIYVVGTYLIVKVLKHKLKLRDEVIGMVGAISQLLFSIAFMISYQTWMIFASSIFGIFKAAVTIAERPVLNRQITALEQGKINSITAVLEKCTSFVIIPLSNYIYNMTLTSLPSSFLIVSALASVVQIVCYAVVEKEPTEIKLKEKESTV